MLLNQRQRFFLELKRKDFKKMENFTGSRTKLRGGGDLNRANCALNLAPKNTEY